jgi:uncharacterized protein
MATSKERPISAKKSTRREPSAPRTASRSRQRVRVFFHRRSKDPESAWCTPLAATNQYRLDNILFLHDSPVYGDTVEAVESERFDGQLACKRIVRKGGRFAMIVDYADVGLGKSLSAFLREKFDVESEGCFGPADGRLGRLYLAVPEHLAARTVFAAATERFDGLVAIHPAIRRGKNARGARSRPMSIPSRTPVAATAPTLFAAIRRNDLAPFAQANPADLAILDERQRPLLFVAVLDGRTAIVKRLIALGAELNPGRFAPLHAAAMRNRAKEAKLLIACGAQPEFARDKDGDPALVTAAFRENVAVLRVLLTVPHSVATKSLALLEAAGIGNLAIVRLLLKHGADPAWRSPRGNSALSIARTRKRADVVTYLTSLTRPS